MPLSTWTINPWHDSERLVFKNKQFLVIGKTVTCVHSYRNIVVLPHSYQTHLISACAAQTYASHHWFKHTSSRTGLWHCWESGLVSLRKKELTELTVVHFLSYFWQKLVSDTTKPSHGRFILGLSESTNPGNTKEPVFEENFSFVVTWRPSQKTITNFDLYRHVFLHKVHAVARAPTVSPYMTISKKHFKISSKTSKRMS